MTHLAVDIGRVSAVAYDSPRGVLSEAQTLGDPGDVPAHLVALERWIDGLVFIFQPHRVYVERHTGRGKGSRTLDAYTAAVRIVCARHGVPCDTSVAAISARKLALGKGIADKAVAGVLAQRMLDIPENVGADEIDARILLAAIPLHLAQLRAKADLARLRRNAVVRAARKAARALRPFPSALVPA